MTVNISATSLLFSVSISFSAFISFSRQLLTNSDRARKCGHPLTVNSSMSCTESMVPDVVQFGQFRQRW